MCEERAHFNLCVYQKMHLIALCKACVYQKMHLIGVYQKMHLITVLRSVPVCVSKNAPNNRIKCIVLYAVRIDTKKSTYALPAHCTLVVDNN